MGCRSAVSPLPPITEDGSGKVGDDGELGPERSWSAHLRVAILSFLAQDPHGLVSGRILSQQMYRPCEGCVGCKRAIR